MGAAASLFRDAMHALRLCSMREVASTDLSVVISRHAIPRHGEHAGLVMGEKLQLREITRVWPHVAVSVVPTSLTR